MYFYDLPLYWQLNIGFMVALIFFSIVYVMLSSSVLKNKENSIFFIKLNRIAVPAVLFMCYMVIVSNLIS